MFAKTIIDSDAFLDMPLSTQALYFHLSMRADDEGFINNPKKVARMIGASDDDMKVLITKNFVIPFESGIVVIKHWRIHNYIRGDRLKETVYQEERSHLCIKDNDSYTLSDKCQSSDSQMSVKCQHRLGKDSIGKDSIGKDSIGKDSIGEIEDSPSNPTRHKYGEYKNVLLSDEDMDKLKSEFPDWKSRIERLSSYMASTGKSYKNHLATIRCWARNDTQNNSNPQNDCGDNVFLAIAKEEGIV